MLSRKEKYKKIAKKKRFLIGLGALLFCLTLVGGVRSAAAGSDISSLLINWFSNKKSDSIQQIEVAISNEKDLLLTDLKKALQVEIESANQELAAYTQLEISARVANLQAYAEELKSGMKFDNSDQEAAIQANLDAIVTNAIALMNSQEVDLSLTPIPPIEEKPDVPDELNPEHPVESDPPPEEPGEKENPEN